MCSISLLNTKWFFLALLTFSTIILFQNCGKLATVTKQNSSLISQEEFPPFADENQNYVMYGPSYLHQFLNKDLNLISNFLHESSNAQKVIVVNDVNDDGKNEFITLHTFFEPTDSTDIRLRDGSTGRIILSTNLTYEMTKFIRIENTNGLRDFVLIYDLDTTTIKLEKRSGKDLSILKSVTIEGTSTAGQVFYQDINLDGNKEIIAHWSDGLKVYDAQLNLMSLNYSFGEDIYNGSSGDIVEDINGDNLADHIIWSPMFSTDTNAMVGKVSLNSGRDGSELWSITGGARFEIVSQFHFLIDYNKDGYTDVAFTKAVPAFSGSNQLFIYDLKNRVYLLENFLPQVSGYPSPIRVGDYNILNDFDKDGFDDFYFTVRPTSNDQEAYKIIIYSGNPSVTNPYLKIIECAAFPSMSCGKYIVNLSGK